MKEFMICCLFLLFGISLNDAHTLSRIKLSNITDVYEVKEGKSSLTISHPKDDKAILREIVYFHVIEKPYDKQDQEAKTPELNKRNFTNGHGYQYVEENNDVIDDTNKEDYNDYDNETPVAEQDDETEQVDDDSETPVAEHDNETTEQDETTEQNDETIEPDEYDDVDTNEIGAKTTESTITDDVDDELKNDANDDEIGTIDDTEIPEDNDDGNNEEPEELDVRFGDSENSPIDNQPIQVQSESRQKREIDYRNLSDAPELPEFKLDILPDYIKAIIFADQEDNKNNKTDNIEDEIEKRVHELVIAVNHPPSVHKENDSKKINARMFGKNPEIDRKGGNGQNEGTYGMSLAGNSGKVWNNINTHHLHYVSEPETHTNTIPILHTTDSTTKASIVTDKPSETSPYEDIRVNNDFKKPEGFNYDLKDVEDSFDEASKLLEELIQNIENETIAPTTVTTDTASDNNIEESYDVEDPMSIEDNNSKKREVRNLDDKKVSPKREIRTYGMSLAGDSGVVWNDVNTPLSYHVGEPDTITSTTSIPEDVSDNTTNTSPVTTDIHTTSFADDNNESKDILESDELKDIEDSLDQINKMLDELLNSTKEAKTPLTDKSTNTASDDKNNSNSKETNDDKNSDEFKNIEDSFDEVKKLLEELIKNSTSEVTTESSKDTSKKPDYKNESTTTSTTEKASFSDSIPTDATTTEVTTMKSTTLDETTDKSTSTHKPDIKKPDDKNDVQKNNNGTTKRDNEDSKQKQFVKELMKNKFFWQWLQDSSAAYLEVMMKKLNDLIKAEVNKQIKQYIDEHKNVTNCKPDNKEAQNKTENPVESNNATDVDTIVTTENPIANNTLEKPVKTNATDANETSTTQNPVVNTEPNETLNNTIDEIENNNNETEDDLARRQNKESKNKIDTPVKIEARNVYGNSVGNGKVTNIFIFNISKDSDLEKIKPLSNGTNGVFVFGLDDTTDKVEEQNKGDKNDKSKDVTAKPETTNEHKDDSDKKNESDIDQVTTAKLEIVTDPATEEPKDNNNDANTESTVEDKQTTSTESSKTTTAITHEDEVLTTEKIIESTTEAAKDSSTENIKDKTETDNSNPPEQDTTTESHKNDSTTQNNDDKLTDSTSQPDDTTKDNNENKTQDGKEPDRDITTTESTKSNEANVDVDTTNDKVETTTENDDSTNDKIENKTENDDTTNDKVNNTTENADTKEIEKDKTTKNTKSNEATTDKVEIDIKRSTGKD